LDEADVGGFAGAIAPRRAENIVGVDDLNTREADGLEIALFAVSSAQPRLEQTKR